MLIKKIFFSAKCDFDCPFTATETGALCPGKKALTLSHSPRFTITEP